MILILAFSYTAEEREGLAEQVFRVWRGVADEAEPRAIELLKPDHLWRLHERAATCARLIVPLRVRPLDGQLLVSTRITGLDADILHGRMDKLPPVELIDLETGRVWPAAGFMPGIEGSYYLLLGAVDAPETEEPQDEPTQDEPMLDEMENISWLAED